MKHFMKCPYCEKIMRSGKLKGDGRSPMKFIPEGEKLSLGDLFIGKGMIDGNYKWGVYTIDVNYCDSCKKMIIDTDIH